MSGGVGTGKIDSKRIRTACLEAQSAMADPVVAGGLKIVCNTHRENAEQFL